MNKEVIIDIENPKDNDLISRQAVLDYIDKMPSELTADGRRMIRRRTLEEYISDTLSSVKQEPKWIPVSEKLPRIGEWVLVTNGKCDGKHCEIMTYHGLKTQIVHRVGEGEYKEQYHEWTSGHGDILSKNPLAWMPLPSLYKGE